MALQQERHFFLEEQTVVLKVADDRKTIILQVREAEDDIRISDLYLTKEEALQLAVELTRFTNEV